MTVAERNELVEANRGLVGTVLDDVCQNPPYPLTRDDLIGAGHIGLVRAVDTYEGRDGAKFSTYAWRVIRNAIIDEICPAARYNEKLPSAPLGAAGDLADPEPGPAELAEGADTARVLLRLSGRLSGQQQQIITMRYEHDMTLDEIGDVLGYNSKGHVHRMLKRALSRLSELAAREFEEVDAHATNPAT